MQNQLENKAFANFFVRFVAFAIDSILVAIIVGMIKLPLTFAAMLGADFLNKNFIFQYSFLDVFSYMGVVAYFVLMTYFTHTTVGKMLFGLEVITADGEWTFINVLYRETIGRFLSSLLCIGYLVVLTKKNRQGFHDMLCDTYVVYKHMKPVRKEHPVTEDHNIIMTNQMYQQNVPVEQPSLPQENVAPVYHNIQQ